MQCVLLGRITGLPRERQWSWMQDELARSAATGVSVARLVYVQIRIVKISKTWKNDKNGLKKHQRHVSVRDRKGCLSTPNHYR